MNKLMIAAPSSNTGKTMLTLGLARALKNRNIDVDAFKTGPDYIDCKYLEFASKSEANNLDLFLMGEREVKEYFYRKDGYKLVEGVMGYFDGLSNTYKYSSFHLAKTLGIPTILVYEAKGEAFTAITKIKGMVDFSDGQIVGIIFNKISNKLYNMLAPKVEEYTGIKALGYIPKDDRLEIKSEGLGLLMPDMINGFEEKIELMSDLINTFVNVDEIIKLSESKAENIIINNDKILSYAIAYDEAFSFHYKDHRANIKYFSPLNDDRLPEADLIVIGGGYPENYKEELSKNKPMINAIREYVEAGGKLIAYGGGFLYLNNSLDDIDMAGVFNGRAYMTKKLQHFGYCNLKLLEDNGLGSIGDEFNVREYHRSVVEIDDEPIFEINKPGTDDRWYDGYRYKNAYGFFAHFHPAAWRDILINLIGER